MFHNCLRHEIDVVPVGRVKVVSCVRTKHGHSPRGWQRERPTSSLMLAARSGLDSEGRRLRASEGAGVRRTPSSSDRWNLGERMIGLELTVTYWLLASVHRRL